jgi:hypothetical protein
MIHAPQPLPPNPAEELPPAALDNPAVARCEAEWGRVHDAVLKKKKASSEAIEQADWAYREAMPAPVGYSNICNFIACVIYGMLMGRLDQEEGPKLLYGAQVALSTIAPQAKTQTRSPQPQVPQAQVPQSQVPQSQASGPYPLPPSQQISW